MPKEATSRNSKQLTPLNPPGLCDNTQRSYLWCPYELDSSSKRFKTQKTKSSSRINGVQDPSTSLNGRQWLSRMTVSFQNVFWAQFIPPVSVKATGSNVWPPFQSHATRVLAKHGWNRFIKANEVWRILRDDHPDILEGWRNAVEGAAESHTLQKGAIKPTIDLIGSNSPAWGSYQTPGGGSSMLSTPSLQTESWSSASSYFGSPGLERGVESPSQTTQLAELLDPAFSDTIWTPYIQGAVHSSHVPPQSPLLNVTPDPYPTFDIEDVNLDLGTALPELARYLLSIGVDLSRPQPVTSAALAEMGYKASEFFD